MYIEIEAVDLKETKEKVKAAKKLFGEEVIVYLFTSGIWIDPFGKEITGGPIKLQKTSKNFYPNCCGERYNYNILYPKLGKGKIKMFIHIRMCKNVYTHKEGE